MKKDIDFYASLAIIAEKGARIAWDRDTRTVNARRPLSKALTWRAEPRLDNVASFWIDGKKATRSITLDPTDAPIACWLKKGVMKCKRLQDIKDVFPSELIPWSLHDEMERKMTAARQGLEPLFPYMHTPRAPELECLMKNSFSNQAERHGLQVQLGMFYGSNQGPRPLINSAMKTGTDELEKSLKDMMKPASTAVLALKSSGKKKAITAAVDSLIGFTVMVSRTINATRRAEIEKLVKSIIDDNLPITAYHVACNSFNKTHVEIITNSWESEWLDEGKMHRSWLQRIPSSDYLPNFNARLYFMNNEKHLQPTFIERWKRLNRQSIYQSIFSTKAFVPDTFLKREDYVVDFLQRGH